jgi:hypothetical protein
MGTGLSENLVQTLAIDPAMPANVYVGTDEGIFKSTNGGGLWSRFNSGLTMTDIKALAFGSTTPASLYAGTNGGGVFITGGPEKLTIYLPLVVR